MDKYRFRRTVAATVIIALSLGVAVKFSKCYDGHIENKETTHIYVVHTNNNVVNSGTYLTEEEISKLIAIVNADTKNKNYECKKAVCSVILNRMATTGLSLDDILNEYNQFPVIYSVDEYKTIDRESYNSVYDIIQNGTTVPEYVTFYNGGSYHTFGDQVPYKEIDNTFFSYSNKEMHNLCY